MLRRRQVLTERWIPHLQVQFRQRRYPARTAPLLREGLSPLPMKKSPLPMRNWRDRTKVRSPSRRAQHQGSKPFFCSLAVAALSANGHARLWTPRRTGLVEDSTARSAVQRLRRQVALTLHSIRADLKRSRPGLAIRNRSRWRSSREISNKGARHTCEVPVGRLRPSCDCSVQPPPPLGTQPPSRRDHPIQPQSRLSTDGRSTVMHPESEGQVSPGPHPGMTGDGERA